MNKVKLFFLSSILILLFSFNVTAADNTEVDLANIKVINFKNEEIEFNVSPQLIDGEIMLELRPLFENGLECYVEWNENEQSIIATDKYTADSYVFRLNSDIMYINDTPFNLNTNVQKINGYSMVPLNSVYECMNIGILYDKATDILQLGVATSEDDRFMIINSKNDEKIDPNSEYEYIGININNFFNKYNSIANEFEGNNLLLSSFEYNDDSRLYHYQLKDNLTFNFYTGLDKEELKRIEYCLSSDEKNNVYNFVRAVLTTISALNNDMSIYEVTEFGQELFNTSNKGDIGGNSIYRGNYLFRISFDNSITFSVTKNDLLK